MITIRYNSEWEEFQVTVKGNAAATHHTDCPVDAMGSARDMARRNGGTVAIHSSAKRRLKGIS